MSSRTDGSHRFDEDERPGGKRTWYADFEPALACTCYSLCSISLSLFNKMVFSGSSFNYPISVLAFQSLCAVVFLQVSDVLKLSDPSPLTKDVLRAMAPVTLLFCLMLWTSGKALRFVSMPTFTVFKNLAVVGTTGWEYARYGSKVSGGIIFSLVLMVSGSIVAGAGDLTASREGFFWMFVNVLFTVSYVASLKELVPPELPSSAKTYANNLLSFALFLGVALSNGEFGGFFSAIGQQTVAFKVALIFTGVIGTAINMSTFWCARVTSGATYAFVGASNKIPVAVIGHFAFHSALTVSGWLGVLLGLGSGFTFAITKERERRHAVAAKSDAERGPLIEDSHSDAGLEPPIPDGAADDADDDLESSKPKEGLRF